MSQTATGLAQQFCVRWNSHLGSLGAAFPQLLAGQRFVDVTLACEGHQVHCHRLVLAACSTYFENLLGENPCKHPIIILPRDIKLWAIQALVDFMYKGEVNVSQAGLPDLMKCAEILKIRGLCGSDAALNLNQVHSPPGSGNQYQQQQHHSSANSNQQQQHHSSANSNDAGETIDHGRTSDGPFTGRHGSGQIQSARLQQTNASSGPKRQLLNSLNLQPIDGSSHQQQNDDGTHSDNGESGNEICIKTEDLVIDEDDTGSRQCGDDDELAMDSNDKSTSDAIRCEQYLGVHPMDAEARVNDRVGSDSLRDRMEEEMEVGEKMIDDGGMVMQKSEPNHPNRHQFVPDEYDNFANANEDGDVDDNDLMEVREETEAATQEAANRKQRKLIPSGQHSTHSNELLAPASSSTSTTASSLSNSSAFSANNTGKSQLQSKANGGSRAIGSVPSLSSINTTVRSVPSGSRGSIRVKSIENLFENYQAKQSPKSSRDKRKITPHPSSVVVLGCSGANISENDSASEHSSSLIYNRNELDAYVKQQRMPKTTGERQPDGVGDETNASTVSDGDGYENIICSPNFPQLNEVGAGGYKAEEDDEDEEYGDEYAIQLLAEEIDSSMLANGGGESEGDEILYKPPALMALGSAKGTHSGKAAGIRSYGTGGPTSTLTIRKLERQARGSVNVPQTNSLTRTVNRRPRLTGRSKDALHQLLNSNGAPPPVPFTLRNPRGNQPRTYNTEALWAALMDVKAGESIYRSSQNATELDETVGHQVRLSDAEAIERGSRKEAHHQRTDQPNTIAGAAYLPAEFPLANVTCEYDLNTEHPVPQDSGTVGRRVRRSEEILRQAAEYVSRGETFQNVSLKFDIPISTIRFYMARKGILPRRKRGRTAMFPCSISNRQQQQQLATIDAVTSTPVSTFIPPPNLIDQQQQQQYRQQLNENMSIADTLSAAAKMVDPSHGEEKPPDETRGGSRSPSPSGPPFHFANYKLPDLRPDLL
uniref:BTB domain-containing protein n=1 Tax=Anopheles epiroticus TaxID=199890 RepID=A0A182PEL8_9DIPT